MIQLFEYKESPIQFEEVDGQVMANATLMCSAFGKRFNDWTNLAQTKRYFEAITSKNGISENQLVTTKKGSAINGGGSWINDRLVIALARWLSVDFEIWCDERIAELKRSGVTSVDGKLSKVIDTMIALAETTKMAMDSVNSLTARVQNLEKNPAPKSQTKKVNTEPENGLYKSATDHIDARHRAYETVERHGGQIRYIKLDDKDYYSMADALVIKGCRTSTGQIAIQLNKIADKMARKIWLFAQTHPAWFVNEDGLNLLFSNR